jgi:glycosyltransferase domain-containing protein
MLNKEAKKELTVIIPLKNRAPYTMRMMAYMDKVAFPFKVLLADGGNENDLSVILSSKSIFPQVDYEYIKYPYDNSYSDYYLKMVDVLSRVKTPLVVMGDNDDFFCVQGLWNSIEFMKTHLDYSICRGEIFRFQFNKKTENNDLNGIYGEINKCQKLYSAASIVHQQASQRIKEHFINYAPTWYDVHRTDQLNHYFKILSDLNIKDIYLAELLISFMAITAGKAKRASYPYLLRQGNAKGSTNARENKNNDIFDRMLLETWSSDFNKFIGAIADELSSQEAINKEEAARAIKKGYRVYAGPNLIKILSGDRLSRFENINPRKITAICKRILRISNITNEINRSNSEYIMIRKYLKHAID